jgi:helix-turn-helix protein
MQCTSKNALAGLYLKDARQSAGLSQEGLARELSGALGLAVSGSQLSYYESATEHPCRLPSCWPRWSSPTTERVGV